MAFENGIIDFRSDTVTHPTARMRKAMASAKVGDDVYGEDPTINQLESLSAQILGKEAALFTASGTMGNLIAVLTHCARGDEAVMGTQGHTFLHEVGGMAALGGVFPHMIPSKANGTMDLNKVKNAIREEDIHHPETRLVIVENTQNACGGIPIPAKYMQELSDLLDPMDIRLHVDGARIFNAGVALNKPAKKLVENADSIMFCLSKGLCAPVGSMLCGSHNFIRRARKIRKQLGGGMRQAGIIAAAGIVALESMIDRLAEDHHRAKMLSEAISEINGLSLEKGEAQTNMVYVAIANDHAVDADELVQTCSDRGILIGKSGSRSFRFVTHYWITDEDIEKLISVLKAAMS